MNEEKYWKMPDWIQMNMISKEGAFIMAKVFITHNTSVLIGKVKVLFQIFLLILFHGGLLSYHTHITKIIIAERTLPLRFVKVKTGSFNKILATFFMMSKGIDKKYRGV